MWEELPPSHHHHQEHQFSLKRTNKAGNKFYFEHFEGNDPEAQQTSELQSRQELADFAGSEIILILHIYQYLKAMCKVLFINNANIQCCYGFTLMDECRLLRELNSRQLETAAETSDWWTGNIKNWIKTVIFLNIYPDKQHGTHPHSLMQCQHFPPPTHFLKLWSIHQQQEPGSSIYIN